MSQPTNSATVQQVEAEQLYEIQVDGRRAGVVAYRDHGDQRVFYHTEVDDAYAGQGLASRLVREALTESRGQGKRIVPVCPYVAAFLKKNTEFAEATDPVTPEISRWLDTVLA
ncbi:MAG TPA: GNAT family N-acetyltransferase [Actinocrinis sp.]|uniref:GNAT family N-acetyltransferase n=1 Tax=Actinocrinis sp. TaxID=1920516 RepID=UPI002D4F0B48|nr:GNAT family N-acetyltransferase [Actinocrinis sp.]HZU58672.1 GNAT family N-acetyltransferase [Actinocrinis sp.]